MNRKHFAFLVISFFFAITCASAEITLEPVSGSLLITSPDGQVKLLDSDEAAPTVLSGSTIEVFQGQFKVTTGAGETVNWACGGNSGAVSGGASVSISCGDDSGLLEVLSGDVKYLDASGVEQTAAAGDKKPLVIAQKKAAPAAAGEETGTDPEDEEGEPDPRSIESSGSN